MGQSFADVTVHIDENLGSSQLELVVNSLQDTRGVESVISHGSRPHMVVVKYDPVRTTSRQIYQAIEHLGYHAELLGL